MTIERPNLDVERKALLRRIRFLLWLFIVGLVLSGLTAFPLVWETALLERLAGAGTAVEREWPRMAFWISRVHEGVAETGREYPFMAYGTDWLAFAHLVIAVAFWGPLRDPVRNVWVVQFGLIACVAVIPLALICGPLRGIPAPWIVIDCMFGVVGFIPLWLTQRSIRRLATLEPENNHAHVAPNSSEGAKK